MLFKRAPNVLITMYMGIIIPQAFKTMTVKSVNG
uniref:Uncharacterized protein n=1 Tax=Medicago truncatula TaxID=3880 RepID=B7FG93_MEDTR|nr:unknown [Medicago truncatula]